ncbi:hypothetical protein [Corynebacterium silvaticum]|uniref:Uncharacterized protein n=1 Tax=Corynebacterium silvaticum TaxID=2320431 RepID=A0ACD4PY80_9CORY|nr:hypothetical protein [Corynebacterium silvaticum]WCV10635.1 hypothetical protein CBE74_13040 [Corynebacterium silvaticum]
MSRSSRRIPFIVSGILAAAIISPAAPALAADTGLVDAVTATQDAE